jgi:hypothetical protein
MQGLVGGLVLCACAAEDPPAGIEKILAYQGTRKLKTEHFNTRFSKASKESMAATPEKSSTSRS